MKKLIAILLPCLLFSCSEEKTDQKEEKKKPETVQKDTTVKMAETSALSYEMRAMEQQMKWIKRQLDTNATWSNEIFIDFHTIDTLQASDHVNQNKQFKEFSSSFMSQYSSLIHEKQSKEQFSMVISECISCHEVFCPGPIPRIKKLNR